MSHISFTYGETTPNWLASEVGKVLKTRQFETAMGQDKDGKKIVVSGTVFPANDSTAEGIVFDNVDVTGSAMEGSVMVAGRVLTERLPATVSAEAKTALEKSGIHFDKTPDVTRPY